jgi:hypothetical protein
VRHPHFKGRPILLGDVVKLKIPGDKTKYGWQTVESIIQEDQGLYEPEQPPPYLGLTGGFEAFLSKKACKNHAYDPDMTGYVTDHKPAGR